jgi:hypothetical protein
MCGPQRDESSDFPVIVASRDRINILLAVVQPSGNRVNAGAGAASLLLPPIERPRTQYLLHRHTDIQKLKTYRETQEKHGFHR